MAEVRSCSTCVHGSGGPWSETCARCDENHRPNYQPKVKHTPGPWSVVRYGGVDNLFICGDCCTLALISRGKDDSGSEANARLIAEAPAMHEALKTFEALWDFSTPVQPNTPITYENPDGINNAMEAAAAILARIDGAQ